MTKEEKRKEHNAQLIERMKAGESLCRVNILESFFPIRPPIKKDKEAIKKLYGEAK